MNKYPRCASQSGNITAKHIIKSVMRTIVLLLTFGLTTVMANDTFSQTRMNIKVEQVSLENLLNEIQRNSKFIFFYRDDILPKGEKVSVAKEDATLESILKPVLNRFNLGFNVNDRQVTIIKLSDTPLLKINNGIKPQSFLISGTIIDSNGEPLPGANVLEQGTTNGTQTDFDGNFSLSLSSSSATLVISYIGFATKEVPVNGQNSVNITLEESAAGLEEVVVVGFGTQKKLNLTGAVSAIDSEDLQNRPITSSSQALQGIQGVYINQVGGQPGNDGATIRIRGVGTLNNNNPLVLVNGIEFPINDLNPNDIESVTVLKDAASAAIYGSRAANGVVLVTTKKGSEQSQISYSNSVGLQEVISLPRVVKDPIRWMELYSQAQLNFGTSEDALVFPQSLIEEYRQGMQTDPFTYPNNDWYDIMFDPAFIQQHNLRFTGGSSKSTYALSLGILDQNGVLRSTDSERYNTNFTVNSDLNKFVSIGGTFNFSYKTRDEPVVGIPEVMEMIFKAQSYHPTKLEDGNYGMNFFDIPGHRRFRSPLALTDEGDTDIRNIKLFLNTFAEIKLPLNIVYKLNIGLTSENERRKIFTPQITLYDAKTKEPTQIQAGGNPYVTFAGQQRGVDQRDDKSFNWTVFNTLKWDKSFTDRTDLSILLGTSYEKFDDSFFTASNEGYLSNNLYELNAGSTNPIVSGTSTESSLVSYFGRANFVLNSKYLFEANFRYDGSSRFAPGNKWGFFPSMSAGWRINEENFLKDIDWLGQLKVRASWGQLGNERIGFFRYLDLISPGQDYTFGNVINPGTAVLVDNDDGISWETTTISNIGVDASFFGGKLTTSFEYFDKTTEDVLRPVGIPSQVGSLGGPIRNIGAIENDGIEFSLGHREYFGNFRYNLSGSVTYITNKVVDLNGEIILEDNSTDGRGPFNITQEGNPINQFLLYQADGLFQSQEEIDAHAFQGTDTQPGYIKYKDLDNNGVIDLNDRQAEGNTIPKYTYSFNLNFGYKNFSLNTFWQGVEGVQTYNKHVSGVPFWFGTSLPVGWANDSWTPENRDASFPILTRYQDTQATLFRPSDYWLLDASYLRLKNIQLAYDFNAEVLESIGMTKLSIFCNAQNLLTFTPLKDFDPETDLIGNNFFDYPSTKIYTIGLNVSF
ncbi:TonB-dependent receptor [Euzebyella marina]|uniref:TonB-dependent receptor n=1 Tax=Euzebyella marina TaxID=1761453 RepID=A0A3G2L2C6_9FLAO|nr:TonB-dependent receptor [Euzebyella marina]AYN66356.1 TonB-dependent receptor [Euzebyella marina]